MIKQVLNYLFIYLFIYLFRFMNLGMEMKLCINLFYITILNLTKVESTAYDYPFGKKKTV